MATFRRQGRHAGSVHIRRIGNDQIVTRVSDRAKQVALVEPDPVLKAVSGDVARRDRKRVCRNVDRIDDGVAKPQRREHRKAAGARAQIEDALDRIRVADERRIPTGKQFAVKDFAQI